MADQKIRFSLSPIGHAQPSILRRLALNINKGPRTLTFSIPTPIQQIEVESKYKNTYEEVHKIGSGNFAMVFKCRNKIDDKYYAVKRTKAKLKCSIERSDARQEACILAKLYSQTQNNNLIQYYHCWIEQNQLFLVMELCDYNLKQQVYEEWEIKQLMKDVLNGLSFLHAQGYVHMDIKPENILFKRSQYRYKIADFGLGRLSQMKDSEDIKDGDSRYMAPELIQYANNSNLVIDLKKVDIFAFGCTLFEIMNQIQLPKNDEEYNKLRRGITSDDFNEVGTFINNPGVQYSETLKTLVCKMMSPNHLDRPTAQEILDSKYLYINPTNHLKFLEMSNRLLLERMQRNAKRYNSYTIKKNTPEMELEYGIELKVSRKYSL